MLEMCDRKKMVFPYFELTNFQCVYWVYYYVNCVSYVQWMQRKGSVG